MSNQNQSYERIKEAFEWSAKDYPNIIGGDPNPADVLYVAHGLMDHANLPLPVTKPDKKKSIDLINFVDSTFICGHLVRRATTEELTKRAYEIFKYIRRNGILPFGAIEDITIALFMWFGCISMAKNTRKVDSAGTSYDLSLRSGGYNYVRSIWEEEEVRGNPWVRYGVSLARELERTRNNNPVDDWIPPESPYWEKWKKSDLQQ